MKEYRMSKLMFWIFFAIGMFYGAFFLFLLEHPPTETNQINSCFTQYELVAPCSLNASLGNLGLSNDYTQLIPYQNETGKYWKCKQQNWTIKAC